MRLVTPVERILITLGPSRNVALLTFDEPIAMADAMAQVAAWTDGWCRFAMVFREFWPWHRADLVDIDLARHVIAIEAGEAAVTDLLITTLTGAIDEDLPPWRVIVVNPADGNTAGPCRVIVHFDHTIADGARFVNILSAGRTHIRNPDEFAELALNARRMTYSGYLRLPRDPRINVPDVALVGTEVRGDLNPENGSRASTTRRLTQAITRAVARVVPERPVNRRCAAVAMTGRRQADAANAITAIEVDSGFDGDPAMLPPFAALVRRCTQKQWFMVAGQTVLSFFPSRLARRLTAGMATQWDGLLTLVPFGRRPLTFAGREAAEVWCLTVPVLPVPLLLLTAAYRNRFQISAVTAWEWRGKAKAFAEAIEEELSSPQPYRPAKVPAVTPAGPQRSPGYERARRLPETGNSPVP